VLIHTDFGSVKFSSSEMRVECSTFAKTVGAM